MNDTLQNKPRVERVKEKYRERFFKLNLDKLNKLPNVSLIRVSKKKQSLNMLQIIRLLLLTCLLLIYTTSALPVESKPLNNNPESWNLYFVPRDPLNPSAEALVGVDPHVKKSKITPKSIFIAPNKNLEHAICPNGYRIDDNGKCIKTVTVNQDDILVSRLAELFGEDDNSNKATNSDSDYYDMFEEEKNGENAGPLQFNIPLMVDIEDGNKKIEYIIEEKVISMRNLPPPQKVVATPVTERISVENVELITTALIPEEITTLTEKVTTEIEETTTEKLTTTTTQSSTTSTSTRAPLPSTLLPYKLNNVDYIPKFTRKSNRTRVKSRPRRPRPTVLTSTVSSVDQIQTPSLILQAPKRTRLRSGSKRRKTTAVPATTSSTTPEVPVTRKPFYWLPKGWTIDETKKDKPVLIRFWADEPEQQQLKSSYDERARSHVSRSQRMNSKKPSEEFFKEVTVPELEEILSPK